MARKPATPHVTRHNIRVHPMFARGGKHHDPRHVLYVVSISEVLSPRAGVLSGLVIVAHTTWLRDWQVGAKVGIYAGVNDLQVVARVQGIVKVETNQVYGSVPNVAIPFWTVN